MLSKPLIIVLSLAAYTSAAALDLNKRVACNADNCLRALRASQIPNRLSQASSDCASVWVTTVTPSELTFTATATISTTSVSTAHITETNTIHQTTTVIEPSTLTVEGGVTRTTTIITARIPNLKRETAQPVGTPTIPAYASLCSGIARFTSACSCIGVTGQATVTAPTPSTTVTITQTLSYLQSTTVTDTTAFITTIDATKTQTSVVSTVTVGSVAIEAWGRFKLSVTYGGIKRYVRISYAGSGLYYLVPSSLNDFTLGAVFSIDPSGALYSLDNGYQKALAVSTAGKQDVHVRMSDSTQFPNDVTLSCKFSDDLTLTCSAGGYIYFDVASSMLNLYSNPDLPSQRSDVYPAIVKAEPF